MQVRTDLHRFARLGTTAGEVRRRPAGYRTGFSLVEMLIVAAIVAVVAAIAAPRYSNSLARYRAEAAARRVVADLDLARNRAMTSNASQTVLFKTLRYNIPALPNMNGGPATEYRVDLAGEPYRLTATSADFGGDGIVTFDAFGVPDSGGTVVLTCGNTSKTVVVNARTGRGVIQ